MTPLLDLKALNAPMQEAIEAAMLRVARSGRYILGPEVEAFEQEWAHYCGTQYCVGTGNALEALKLILIAMDIRRGREVIVPSNTYIATWLSVTHAGARPVPVEPDLATMNIDPAKVEAAITPRTAAIIAVHLYGRPAPMEELSAIARRHGLLLLEDAAQAHGARAGGRRQRAGSLGDAAAFSFYPSKNLGALGDAGCVTTDNLALAEKLRRLRNYGGVGRLDHTMQGHNSRLDEMQAAVLRAKLPSLEWLNMFRRERAETYTGSLTGVITPEHMSGHCWHQYVIRHQCRDDLIRRMAARGVDAHVHYPIPPHREAAYTHHGYGKGSLPIAELLGAQVMSLPIGNDVDVEHIAQVVNEEAQATASLAA